MAILVSFFSNWPENEAKTSNKVSVYSTSFISTPSNGRKLSYPLTLAHSLTAIVLITVISLGLTISSYFLSSYLGFSGASGITISSGFTINLGYSLTLKEIPSNNIVQVSD